MKTVTANFDFSRLEKGDSVRVEALSRRPVKKAPKGKFKGKGGGASLRREEREASIERAIDRAREEIEHLAKKGYTNEELTDYVEHSYPKIAQDDDYNENLFRHIDRHAPPVKTGKGKGGRKHRSMSEDDALALRKSARKEIQKNTEKEEEQETEKQDDNSPQHLHTDVRKIKGKNSRHDREVEDEYHTDKEGNLYKDGEKAKDDSQHGNWFENMSEEAQKKYIERHPESKYAKNANKKEEPAKVDYSDSDEPPPIMGLASFNKMKIGDTITILATKK